MQTSYGQQGVPFAGVLYDSSMVQDIVSAANTDAINMPFGVMVSLDTADDTGAKLPTVTGAIFLGVNLFSNSHERGPNGDLTDTGLIPGAQLNLLRKGRVWVKVEEAVNKGDQAYVRYAANGGNTQLGSFRKSADAGPSAVAIKARYFTSQATIGGVAAVDIDLDVF